jgi:parvulin-like peptidyl-prolyl isomerase
LFYALVPFCLITFSITGVIMSVLTPSGGGRPVEAFGEEVDPGEMDKARFEAGAMARFFGNSGSVDEDQAWQRLVLMRKAEEAGIRVSDKEVAAFAQEQYRNLAAQQRAISEGVPANQIRFRAFQYVQETRFDREQYIDWLKTVGLTAAQFEEACRGSLSIQRLSNLVRSGGKADPSKLFEEYQRQNHKRRARYAVLSAEMFIPSAENVTDEELEKYHEDNSTKFTEARTVELAYMLFPAEDQKAVVTAPTDEELQKRYDRNKERYLLVPEASEEGEAEGEGEGEGEGAGEDEEPKLQYRPLEEVKAELVEEITTERALAAARKAAGEVKKGREADLAEGKVIDLQATALQTGATHGTTGKVEPKDLIEQKEIKHFRLITLADTLEDDAFSNVLQNDNGAFFVQLVLRTEARLVPFEEAKDKVRTVYTGGDDDELREYYGRHNPKYKEEEKVRLIYFTIRDQKIKNKFKSDLEGKEGDDLKQALREKSLEELAEITADFAKENEDGARPSLEDVLLKLGYYLDAEEDEAIITRSAGQDLPEELKISDLEAQLLILQDKSGELSDPVENKTEDGLIVFQVIGKEEARVPPFEEIAERVKKDVLLERGFARLRTQADELADDFRSNPGDFHATMETLGAEIKDSALIRRDAKIEDAETALEGVPAGNQLPGALFRIEELGGTGQPLYDFAEQKAVMFRFIEREAADVEGFAEKRQEVGRFLTQQAESEELNRWSLNLLLDARSADKNSIQTLYSLLHGPEGLDTIKARHVYIEADKEVIEEALLEEARVQAKNLLAEISAGKTTFERAARANSDDPDTKGRGGRFRSEVTRVSRNVPDAVRTAIFELATANEIGGPIETEGGVHLVKLLAINGGKRKAAQIFLSKERQSDPDTGELEGLSADVLTRALSTARPKIEEARQRLADGENFEVVSEDLSTERFSGSATQYPFLTAFELQVLAQAKKIEPKGDVDPSILESLSEPFVYGDGAHLLHVQPYTDRSSRGQGGTRVWHIFVKGDAAVATLQGMRDDIASEYLEEMEDDNDNRASLLSQRSALTKVFESYAKEHSEAPTGKHGGELFVMAQVDAFERYGVAFREGLYGLKDGETSSIIQGDEGFHIIHVEERETKTFEEARDNLANSLLQSMDL